MPYEAVIGLEVHAQLLTQSKMFCGCGTRFGMPPNTQTCPVCLGMPGTLPVINRTAVEMAIRTGLALNCAIRPVNRFARKNYFYPDLPKGYQISQYEAPICEHGWMDVAAGDRARRVRIRRAHLEEDAGKNVHDGGRMSRVDLNRAGTPLLEIVTEPDMRSSEEVVAYLKNLRDLLVYLDVCDGNMEEGSMRCEPNVSLRPVGREALGTKVELKNINSFRFVKDALEYEIQRQASVLDAGGTVRQETRLWDVDKEQTAVMRSKEEAHDYRYFPDPDLVPVKITQEWIADVRGALPELPSAKHRRFVSEYGLSDYDAAVLTADRQRADWFERAVNSFAKQIGVSPKDVAKETNSWMMVELTERLNRTSPSTPLERVEPDYLVEVLVRKHRGEINGPQAKLILDELFEPPPGQVVMPEAVSGRFSAPYKKSIQDIINSKGLTQLSDEGEIGKIVDEVVAKNPAQVAQYRAGKEQVLGFFVGQVMKASGGKANPGKVNELLKKKLAA